uniref:Uncharacterized protein n=1 Tax=viral metagenome TaxID=1070528 RepID=A0A6C0B1X5_9ZZZZ
MTTYIKNKGFTETFFQDDHRHKKSSQMKWEADYNGNIANIKVNVDNNGKKNKYQMQFNNEDLANILSVPAVNQPLHQRLQQDFLSDALPSDDELYFEQEPQPILFQMNVPTREEYSSNSSSIPSLTSLMSPLSTREKKARLYTPKPKTMRIHYTTARGTGKKRKSKSTKRRKSVKRHKRTSHSNPTPLAQFFGNRL